MLSWEYPPRVVGGLSHAVGELSRSLAAAGNEVLVITAADHGLSEQERVDGVEIYRVFPYHGRSLNFTGWVQQLNLAMLEKGAFLCRQEPFDIIHAHDWLVAYAARGLKHAFHIPLVATIHATEYGRNGGLYNDEQRYIAEVEWWLTYESWKVVCCSRFMREEVERVFDLPGDKVKIIHNGIRPEAFIAEVADPAVRERYAAPGEKIIFFIGRLVREKGVQVLLEALPQIRERFPVKAVVAGSGPYEEELHRLARQFGIDRLVRFAGFVDDQTRNQLYAHADVAVFPSLYEPFGLVALEAMATGTPVVVGDTGGFTETVEHGVNGLRSMPGSAADLAGQVTRLLEDRELAERLAARGRADVKEKYIWEALARQTEELYQSILFSPEARQWRQEAVKKPEPVWKAETVLSSPPGRYR